MKITRVCLLLLLACPAILAQDSNGYFFLGATKPHNSAFTRFQSTFAHAGGGGELAFNKWFGYGAEVGVLATSNNRSRTVGLFSTGPYFHFAGESKIDPFVTGGYSMLVRGGVLNLWNAGGGVNYWINDRIGVRAEFRDHVSVASEGLQLLDFRFGVVIRTP